MLEIQVLDSARANRALDDLSVLLVDAVTGGASVGFVLPFTVQDARRWWKRKLPEVDGGDLVVFAAWIDGRLVGTVQLSLSGMPNGRHRAEVAKLLVHSSARRQGIGRALMRAVEDLARQHGRTLLVLDTQTGSPAEALYRSLGWVAVGVIPDFATAPDGVLRGTTLFYRQLSA